MRNLFKYSGFTVLSILFSGVLISQIAAQTNEHKLVGAVQQKISNYYPENNISATARENGKIELKGTVNVLYDKLKIFELASGIKGVHYIENNILIDTNTLPDDVILANIKNELKLVKSISEPDLLDIAVNNGIVFLKGRVRFQHESTEAESVASWQKGVKGIINELQVMPIMESISDVTLNAAINDLLENQFALEQVHFNVNLGHVTLNGNVRNLWAKDHIEKEIRRIVGITKVTNKLTVAEYNS